MIKLHVGATAEQLLVGGRQGIKFALGENPKQSNMGGRNQSPRYPQTRMGVIESIRQAFIAAENYEREWQAYEDLTPGCSEAARAAPHATSSSRRCSRSSKVSGPSTATPTARTRCWR